MYDEKGYKLLAVAIVEQAARDAMGWTSNNKECHSKKRQMDEVKDFFCNDKSIFGLCMPRTDGKALYKKIIENYNKYGKFQPFIK